MTSAWDDLLLSGSRRWPRRRRSSSPRNYDGTLAPLVDDPTLAEPDRESLRLLGELAALPRTHVAVVFRVALARTWCGSPACRTPCTSSAPTAEFDADWSDQLPESVVELRGGSRRRSSASLRTCPVRP